MRLPRRADRGDEDQAQEREAAFVAAQGRRDVAHRASLLNCGIRVLLAVPAHAAYSGDVRATPAMHAGGERAG